MKTHLLRDIAGILLIYVLYGIVVVEMYGGPDIFFDQTPLEPMEVLAASLIGTLVWYILGEWVIRPNAPRMTWYATWFIILALILGCACWVSFNEGLEKGFFSLHFVGGFLAYYISSVLFSPTFAKYLIWPARIVRKW